jgi:hypothetical protein
MIVLAPPPTVRIHWIYEDPSGVPESSIRPAA